MRRRAILAAGLFLGALALPNGGAAARTIKIGVILTYSGPEAELGQEIDRGLTLYIKEHETALPPGVKIELVKRDDTGPNPAVAKRLAQELVTRQHVQFLTGVVWTPNAAAIAPIATAAKTPFIIMNAAASALTRMSPDIIRVSYTLWQLTAPLGQWTAAQGWKTAYTAVSDFSPGYECEAGFTSSFVAGGGKMVGAVRIPLTTEDFVPFLQRVKDVKPAVLYVFTPAGRQSVAIMKAMTDLDFKDAGIKVVAAADLVSEVELNTIGNPALGVVSTSNYAAISSIPANRAFVAAWERTYGARSLPNFLSVGGWDGMAAIFDVIRQTKGHFTADQAMAILSHWKDPNSPRGPIAIDPKTRDIIQNVYLRRVERVNGRLANVEFGTIAQVKDPWKELHPLK